MNRFFITLLIGFSSLQLYAQQQITFTYQTELPFQTAFDSEFYHLESSMLLRVVTEEITAATEHYQKQPKDLVFNVNFKSLTGASLRVDYGVSAEVLAFYFDPARSIEVFKTDTYNWMNRAFRSNIPFKD